MAGSDPQLPGSTCNRTWLVIFDRVDAGVTEFFVPILEFLWDSVIQGDNRSASHL
jgi:hypothetical protein